MSTQIKRIKQITASLIVLLLMIGLYQWLSPLLQQSFSLTDWTVKIVEQLINTLNWQTSPGFQLYSTIMLFLFLSITTAVGLPRQIAAFVAGLNLGALMGVVIATLATTLGCLLTFTLSRYLFCNSVSRKYPKQLQTISQFLAEKTFLKALAIRLLPLGSNFITNIVAGGSKVSVTAYVGGSFVGFIPQMVIFSLAGSGIKLGSNDQLIVSGILFVCAIAISAYLVKVHKLLTKQEKTNLHQ